MDLAKHIKYLLQFHECVIIPGFGGFIYNYQPAGYNNVTQTFTPPSKQVIFNSKITKNDGLLINQLVDAEGMGYRQAQLAVLKFTDSLYHKLNSGQTVDLENLGSFRYNNEGVIEFNTAINFELIEAYGLKPFAFSTISGSKPVMTYQTRPAVRALQHNNNWLKVAAGIALVLSLSLFPLKNNDLHLQSSNLIPMHLLNNEPDGAVVEVMNEALDTSEGLVVDQVVSKEKAPYILVGGSFEYLKNAQILTDELIADGHNAEILLLDNGYFRVVIDSYFDRNEALDAMESYRSVHAGSMVWVSTR